MTRLSRTALIAMLLGLPVAGFAADKPPFKEADSDGSGKVSMQEAKNAGIPAEEAKKVDINDDGKLTKNDWHFADVNPVGRDDSGESSS